MPNSPRAGQPAQPEDLVDVDALLAAYHDRHPDPTHPRPSGWRSAPRGTAARRCPPRSTTTTSRPPARPSSSTGRRRAPTARCSSAATPTRCPSPPGSPRCEVFLANDVHVLVDSADGYTPTPAVSTAIIGANRRPHRRPGRWRRHHARATTRPATAASSTTRRTAARPTPTPPAGSRTAPTSCCSPSSTGVQRAPARPRRAGPVRLPRRVRRRPAERGGPRRDPVGGRADRRGPARRGERRLLGRHRRTAQDRPDRGEPRRRPAVRRS